MTRAAWERVEEVFHAAAGLRGRERAATVERLCAGDEGLRREVEGLLASHDEPGMEDLPPGSEPARGALAPGSVLGRYRVVRVLGSGGMGTVYEAVADPPGRTVALKVLGAASEDSARRFGLESQVLARLRHPGIAQVLDAGTVRGPGGQELLFIAMELVPEGRPITRYAEERGLDARARLDLFARVCEAVQHAHSKGVVHRDLKPANILVDGAGNPQIIDFGVARATGADLARTTLATSLGQIIGTLAYMSPEQCAGDPHELDTRTDVYALGVVLYELLSGQLPHRVDQALMHEAVRMIRDEEPRRLSAIDRMFRGDVETIVAKALAKEKERRYQTASDLAGDIRRYLQSQPILARPASARYQLAKLARRHAGVVGAGAAALAILVAALGATTWLYLRAERAREREVQQATAARDARDQARVEAERTGAVLEFLVEMLSTADPARARGDQLTVREVLDATGAAMATRLEGQPGVRAVLDRTLGLTYQSIGLMAAAERHLRRAYEAETAVGERRRVADAAVNLAALLWKRAELYEAQALLKQVIEELKDDADPAVLARAHLEVGSMQHLSNAQEPALKSFRRSIEIARGAGPRARTTLATALEHSGSVMYSLGRLAEARAALEESVALARAEGPDDLAAASKLVALGRVLGGDGEAERAAEMVEEALTLTRRAYGPEHRNTAIFMINAGLAWARAGEVERGLAMCLEAVPILERHHKGPHINLVLAHLRIGGLHEQRDDLAAAEESYLAARAVAEAITPLDDSLVSLAWTFTGTLLAQQGRYAEALAVLEEHAPSAERTHTSIDAAHVRRHAARARSLEEVGRVEEAEQAWLALHERVRAGGGAPATRDTAVLISEFYARLGRAPDAAAWAERAK